MDVKVVPPWMSGIACHGPLTVEVWESDSMGGGNDNGPRRYPTHASASSFGYGSLLSQEYNSCCCLVVFVGIVSPATAPSFGLIAGVQGNDRTHY